MSQSVKPIPQGFHTVTPGLIVEDGTKAIEFYKKAFGAEESVCMRGPNGKIMHAELKIGDSHVFLNDEFPEMGQHSAKRLGGSPMGLYLYVLDTDASFQRAVDAGATVLMPPTDMFWGDRFAKVQDPYGIQWAIATHKEDVTPDEMMRRQQQWMKECASQKN